MSTSRGGDANEAPRTESGPGRNGGEPAGPVIGILEWFRPGEHERVEAVLGDLRVLGVQHVRTGVSWADWHTPEGQQWYRWLLPRLASQAELLPCFLYTPPTLGLAAKTSSPPRDPEVYADFIDQMITLFGRHFEWIEFWNEPNNLREWDITLDPEWRIFSEMVGGAAYWAKHRGRKTVMGGISPIDPNWVRLMFERGVMEYIDAVGVHGFPGTFDYSWDGWKQSIGRVREVVRRHGSKAEVWITETGFSTRRHDERQQVREFVRAAEADVERVYWYSAYDLNPELPTVDGFHLDERDYHFGLKRTDGTPKLLYRLWSNGGLAAVKEAAWISEPARIPRNGKRPVLITGGAGFIGTNVADRLLRSGRSVILFDNLSRPGTEQNLRWLRETHGSRVHVEVADVRDPFALRRAVQSAAEVYHFAAQVAVTTSLTGPIYDFEVNLRGTLNLLEALRALDIPPPLIFTSTNKVYGALQDVGLVFNGSRYEPENPDLRSTGVGEWRPLDFHSPYGCSKGAADQYVLDYARIYGLPAVVFRMSCIYGQHQHGNEDQGWVAHFLISAIEGSPITLYGDGMQVRDVLNVDDLVNAFLLAQEKMTALSGQAFNIGGGPENTISLLELLEIITELQGRKPAIRFDSWRPGDQRYYVSDTAKFRAATGWSPRVNVSEGVRRLYGWLLESRASEAQAAKGERGNAYRAVAAKPR